MEKIQHIRTMEEVASSTAYGRLYRVWRKVGSRFLVVRYRKNTKKGILYADKSEVITLERTDASKMQVRVGDLCFQDSLGTWALWSIPEDSYLPEGSIRLYNEVSPDAPVDTSATSEEIPNE